MDGSLSLRLDPLGLSGSCRSWARHCCIEQDWLQHHNMPHLQPLITSNVGCFQRLFFKPMQLVALVFVTVRVACASEMVIQQCRMAWQTLLRIIQVLALTLLPAWTHKLACSLAAGSPGHAASRAPGFNDKINKPGGIWKSAGRAALEAHLSSAPQQHQLCSSGAGGRERRCECEGRLRGQQKCGQQQQQQCYPGWCEATCCRQQQHGDGNRRRHPAHGRSSTSWCARWWCRVPLRGGQSHLGLCNSYRTQGPKRRAACGSGWAQQGQPAAAGTDGRWHGQTWAQRGGSRGK